MDINETSDKAYDECQGRNVSVVNCDGTVLSSFFPLPALQLTPDSG